MKIQPNLGAFGPYFKRKDCYSPPTLYGSNDMGSIDVYHCVHGGSSMEPTLRSGDLLEISPHQKNLIRVGDVVVFRPPGQRNLIIHRVVSRTAKGLRTKGDNGSSLDPHALLEEAIAGRVVAAWRGHKRLIIRGGRIGLILANLSREINKIEQLFCALFFPLYMALARLDVSKNLLPAPLKPRVIVFRVNGYDQYRLMMGRSMVGHYDKKRGRWQLRRPYRLFVDELALSKSCGDTVSRSFPSPSIEPLDVPSSDL